MRIPLQNTKYEEVCAQFPQTQRECPILQHIFHFYVSPPAWPTKVFLASFCFVSFHFKFVRDTSFLLTNLPFHVKSNGPREYFFNMILFRFRFVLLLRLHDGENDLYHTCWGKHRITKLYMLLTPKTLGHWEENWQTKIEPGKKETEFKRKGQSRRKSGRRVSAGRNNHRCGEVWRGASLRPKEATTVHLWLRQWPETGHFRPQSLQNLYCENSKIFTTHNDTSLRNRR